MNDTITIHFSGERYIAPGLDFETPGDYLVTAEKARQLLADFPDLFSAVKTAPTKDTTPEVSTTPAKPLSKDHKKGNA